MIFKTFEEEIKELNLNMYKYILEGKQTGYPQVFGLKKEAKKHLKHFYFTIYMKFWDIQKMKYLMT